MQEVLPAITALIPYLEGKKILLVRGGSFDSLSISAAFEGLECVHFKDFAPNPLYEQVAEGVRVFQREDCDAIVAVGGGSAMDVAKCIKLFCHMDPARNYLEQPYEDTGVLLAAVPTTAGSGSEATRHAVIYYQGTKQSISHESIVPSLAVLEPSVLESLPVYQKKCTMMDALCQAIESWWSVNACEESIAYSKAAIKLIVDNWEEYILGGAARATNECSAAIMQAANLSGRAINITATTAAHAMSYKITSLYGIPHGHAVAICLAQVWEHMLGMAPRLDDIARSIDFDYFRGMLSRMGLDGPVSAHREEDIAVLASSVNPVRLKNNPVPLTEAQLKSLYERIIK
ncbi:MAG: phosphonoacetaldehyde reductase [Saccharofermentans sp.]|nr:phosphonoacetaldehyde reductase [Saccharofermentans sp.]